MIMNLQTAIEQYPIMRYFAYDHLPEHLQPISQAICEVALDICSKELKGPEMSAGLRKLLEAKDCFVRAALT